MEPGFDDIASLLEAVEAHQVSARVSAADPRWKAVLLFRADESGEIVDCQDLASSDVPPSAPSPLAAALVARLVHNQRVQTQSLFDDGQIAIAARVPDQAGGGILGCVFQGASSDARPPDEGQAAGLLAAAIAQAERQQRAANGRLTTRIRHLLSERDTLKVSHAQALTAAIEEREGRLREQEAHASQLQAVMMMAADGIITLNERGVIESFNEVAGSIFGYAPPEVIGKHVSLLIPLPQRAPCDGRLMAFFDDIRPGGVSGLRREVVGRRRDGSVFPMDLAVSEVHVGERRIFTGIFRDITERKRAEEELKHLHLQNQMILNSAGEGIVGLNPGGDAIFINPAAARMLGYEVGDLVGKPLHELIHHTRPDGNPCSREDCPVLKPTPSSATFSMGNQVFWRRDGSSFPIEYTSTEIQENGGVAGLVITFRDISERRMLEAQLRQAQKLESIGQLAAGIAHEINTPTQYIGDNTRFLDDAFRDLRPLLTSALELRREEDPAATEQVLARLRQEVEQADVDYLLEEVPKAISQSLDGVQRVAKIVRSMKEFSHPGGEKMQAVDLNRAIESTLTVSRNEWKYVAEAVVDLDRNLPLVTCMPGDINQVILNLIVNAAHAIADRPSSEAAEKGQITVRTLRDGDWAEIRIQDNGTGIPAEIRSRVYDPFFTTKAVGRGTGQGLAIAHSIVNDRHHGTIGFETEEGKGTTFIIRLPIHETSTASGAPLS